MKCVPRPYLVLSLLAALLLAVLPACAGTTPAAPTAAPAKPATTAAAPAPAATTTGAAQAAATPVPPAKVTEYNVTVITDYTGPGAESIKFVDPARKVAFAWWNDTKGKELGIKINLKFYDGRSDPSQVASLWPGIVTGDKPLFHIGYGGADTTAIQQRLATDKIPVFVGSFGQGFSWLPDQWLFYAQSSAVHNIAGFVGWRVSTWTENRPVRIGQLSSDQNPTTKDQVAGTQAFMNKGLFAGKAEYAGVEWVPLMATDVANAIKRLIDNKADYIHTPLPSQPDIAALRAILQYKSNAKLVFGSGTGQTLLAKSVPMTDLEGTMETVGYANYLEDIEARKIYDQYKDKAGVGSFEWESTSVVGWAYAIIGLRGVERAAKAVGADKLTGEAIYNAMFTGPFTSKELLGVVGDIAYTKEAPFPTKNAKVRISTVKDGKYGLAAQDWVTVPNLDKW